MDPRQRPGLGLMGGGPMPAAPMLSGTYPTMYPVPQGMPPEMMQAIPMPMGGIIMAPGMMPMPMPRMTGMPLMAPHVTQMLADAAKGGRSSNVFFKTRICNKWRAGNCPYGDKCTYAHGEHELRYVPPELVAQLEAEQRSQEAQQKQEVQQQQLAAAKAPVDGGGGPPPARSYYKTRLCIKFMQTGFCSKGMSCTFAHGYEDLRQPDAPLPPHVQQQLASRGISLGGEAGGRVTSPRAPYRGGQQRGRGPQSADGSERRFLGDAAAVERARALSAIAGVGAADQHADPAVVQSVVAAARSGAAFQENPYSDGVGDHLATAQQQGLPPPPQQQHTPEG